MQSARHIPRRCLHPRRGFTLVELLVVIVVIGILAALLIPAVTGAMKKARETQVVAEMQGFDSALVEFKNRYGQNVPSFLVLYEQGAGSATTPNWGDDTATALPGGADGYRRSSMAFIRQLWPDFNFGLNHDFNGDSDATDVFVLNGTECLVFFLGGVFRRGAVAGSFDDDVQIGFAANPQDPFDQSSTNNRVGPFTTFDVGRYTDIDGDDMPEYRDQLPGQQLPYVYCSSYDGRGYQPYGLNATANDLDDEIPQQGGTVLIDDLYRKDDGSTPPGSTVGPHLNPKTYQIISPGGDDYDFGTGGEYDGDAVDAATTPARAVERDNITNFKNGRLN